VAAVAVIVAAVAVTIWVVFQMVARHRRPGGNESNNNRDGGGRMTSATSNPVFSPITFRSDVGQRDRVEESGESAASVRGRPVTVYSRPGEAIDTLSADAYNDDDNFVVSA
jgi:hypothetical protein